MNGNAESSTRAEANKPKTHAATQERLRLAAHRGARDPVVLRRSLRVVRAAVEQGIIEADDPDALRRWAAEQAAKLPPLSDAQVAITAKLAAELDAKHARQDGGSRG